MTRIALLVVAASTLLAFQQQTRFGNAVFKLPPGWRAVEQHGRMFVTPGGLPPRQELILFFTPGQELAGDLRGQFEQFVQSVIPGHEPGDRGAIDVYPGNGMQIIAQAISLGAGADRQLWMFVGMTPGGRFESYVIAAMPAGLYPRYQREIQALLETLTYQTAPAAAPSPYPVLPERAPMPGGARPPVLPQATPGVYDGAAPARQSASPAPGGRVSLPPLTPRPGHAIGRVVDAAGQPLDNVTISISQVYSEVGIARYGYSSTGSHPVGGGRYDVELPAGVFRVTAFAKRDFEGKTFTSELQPLDGQDARVALPSGPGIVRDFVLLDQGLRAGRTEDRWGTSSLGATLSIEDLIGRAVQAEVTLTPIGPTLDGSAGRAIRQSGQVVFAIKNIPVGRYRVEVRVGGYPVDFEIRDSDNTSYGRGPFVFEPNDAGIAGVKRMRLMIK
jgi:hypothetical protein